MRIFEKGDNVSVLDDDLSGHITEIKGNTITIETTDGFNLDFDKNELVVIKDQFKVELSANDILDKEQPKRKNTPRKKAKERYEPTLEVDLHIHQLTDSFRGMSNHDMLTLQIDTARRQLEFAINKRIQKAVFIHGVGEGVLKMELEYLFGRYSNIKYYDADFQKYGVGATEVYIYQNVKSDY